MVSFFWTGMGGAVLMTAVGLFHWQAMSAPDWAWMAVLCCTAVLGHWLMIRSLEVAEASAVHGIDVGPALYSVRGGLNGPSESSVRMATRAASSWGAFAATGDPTNDQVPAWAPYTQAKRRTMIFATGCWLR